MQRLLIMYECVCVLVYMTFLLPKRIRTFDDDDCDYDKIADMSGALHCKKNLAPS